MTISGQAVLVIKFIDKLARGFTLGLQSCSALSNTEQLRDFGIFRTAAGPPQKFEPHLQRMNDRISHRFAGSLGQFVRELARPGIFDMKCVAHAGYVPHLFRRCQPAARLSSVTFSLV